MRRLGLGLLRRLAGVGVVRVGDRQEHPLGGHVADHQAQVLARADALGQLGLQEIAGDAQRAAPAAVGATTRAITARPGTILMSGPTSTRSSAQVDGHGCACAQELCST